MIFVVIGVFVVVTGLVAYGIQKMGHRTTDARSRSTPGALKPHAQTPSPARIPDPTPAAPPRASRALRDFRFALPSELEPQRVNALLARLRALPRPPSAMHQLVSEDFLAHATSTDLSDIVMAEPRVAARVLAAVNSPLYGLQRPVSNIDQAVKLLGMNTVRGICLRHILDDAFATNNPDLRKVYEELWNTSALACELCFQLAQHLQLQEAGTLVTQLVLSFLGRMATCSMLDPEAVHALLAKDMLERIRFEQQQLGLASVEIGGLLMQDWSLPKSIVSAVRDIDTVLVTPAAATSTSRRTSLALCYLCSRLAEKLATGEAKDPATFDLAAQTTDTFCHFHSYLDRATLLRVMDFLQSPTVATTIRRMLDSMQVQPPP